MWTIILTLILRFQQSSTISYNQPNFCPNASWNPMATTLIPNHTIGSIPRTLFVNTLNTLFVAQPQNGQIFIGRNGSVNPITSILANLSSPQSLFVTDDGEIFVDNGNASNRVDGWTSNGTQLPSPMSVCSQCFGLFVDSNDDLYCSQYNAHQVVRRSLQNPSSPTTIVAGTGCWGSTATTLNDPWGIFVTDQFDLYVADSNNNRIQIFRSGEVNGRTVTINGSNGITITLNRPTGVMLDGDGYLFIVDYNTHRVIGSGPWGFRCVAGCSGGGSSASNQLNYPKTMNFDRDGNLVVLDTSNARVQKFFLARNSCSDSTWMGTTVQTNGFTSKEIETSTSLTTVQTNRLTSTGKESSTSITGIPTSTVLRSIVNPICSSPSIILIPSSSNVSFPLQFRRDEDFWISSIIELNCNKSFGLQMQWTISNGSNSFLFVDSSISMRTSELFLPSRILPFGVYQLILTVTFNRSSNVTKSVYVQINPAGITANLVPLGTSMISRGEGQDLELNPGLYSIDLDEEQFNASDWTYEYYCRIYGVSNFPNIQGVLIPLDDSRVDPSNPSCLNNRTGNGSSWRYAGVSGSSKSSLIILGGSFLANRTYQLMVQLTNRRNQSRQGSSSFLLVRVEETFSQMIIIGCVIESLCIPNLEYQLLNPTSQASLIAFCLGNCSLERNITWNIYQGEKNSSSSTNNFTQWTRFNSTNLPDIFGLNADHFTVDRPFFLSNPSISLWRFEVVYSFPTSTSSSALDFLINHPLSNGSCSISPTNGTTLTLKSRRGFP